MKCFLGQVIDKELWAPCSPDLCPFVLYAPLQLARGLVTKVRYTVTTHGEVQERVKTGSKECWGIECEIKLPEGVALTVGATG
jgi:hypothetical protein